MTQSSCKLRSELRRAEQACIENVAQDHRITGYVHTHQLAHDQKRT